MKIPLRQIPSLLLVALASSCATTSMVKSWKSPEHASGPVTSVATVAIDERIQVRKLFEGQFASQLEKRGHTVVRANELLSLDEIKADRKGASARLRGAGAQTALAVRLLDAVTYAREYREGSSSYVPVTTGFYT